MSNPLLTPSDLPFDLPDFAEITDAHFAPALDAAEAETRASIDEIRANPDAPTFENTIEALETADMPLHDVMDPFFLLAAVSSTPEREKLQRAFSPRLSALHSDIMLDARLFARVDTLWEQRESLDLTEEQQRVLFLHHRAFRRAGASLDEADRARLKEINTALSEKSTAFGQNLLADERDWSMKVEDLAGLPSFLVDAMKAAAQEAGRKTPIITLSRSLVVPFLQFCPDRESRRKAFEAWKSRGANGGKTDNRALAAEMLALRAERAKLLGYDSFADFRLETEMAKSPQNVRDLLHAVWSPARAQAEADARVLERRLHADGFDGPLEPWDWLFYSEARRKEEHALDEAELKPYFQLDRMIEAAFSCANRLFSLEFAPLDVPLHHPDARAWEVTRDGEHLAVFIADYFARPGKRSGAWCSALRSQQKLAGDIRPHVVNVCNFAKPPADQAALLSYDDARTLFHEFGHALHQMLSDVTYASVSGTSVSRDFVELPSQLYEHWLEVPEVLAEFATHAETGQPMPEDLLTRVLAAATYDMGYQTCEYVASALVDLEFHAAATPPADPMQKQAEVLEQIGLPRAIRMRHGTPNFSHIFAGGYASAYYSYMWSEVMDADAFAAFEEGEGAFDLTLARSLESNILSAGGTREPEELYKAFRGRLPGVEALLKGRGLDSVA